MPPQKKVCKTFEGPTKQHPNNPSPTGRRSKDEYKLVEHFKEKNWALYKPSDIAKAISKLEKTPYENDPYVIAAKILLRNSQEHV